MVYDHLPTSGHRHWPLHQLDIKMHSCMVSCRKRFTWISLLVLLLLVALTLFAITGNDFAGIRRLKSHLQSHFQMKDMGPLKYFLGIEVGSICL